MSDEKPRQPKHLRAMVAAALAAAVPLLGVSLGVSAAPAPDGAGPAPGAKSVPAGQKLAQKESAEPPLAPRTLQSKQMKISKPGESRQHKGERRGRKQHIIIFKR